MLNLIEQYAASEFASGDDQSVVDKLNATTIEHRNTELQSIRAVRVKLGEAIATAAAGGLTAAAQQNPLMDAMYIAVSTTGIDFAAPETQETIDQLTAAGVWNADVGAALQLMGVWYTSPAQEHLGRDVTLAEVAQLRVDLAATTAKTSLHQMQAELHNEITAAIESGEITDTAGILALVKERIS